MTEEPDVDSPESDWNAPFGTFAGEIKTSSPSRNTSITNFPELDPELDCMIMDELNAWANLDQNPKTRSESTPEPEDSLKMDIQAWGARLTSDSDSGDSVEWDPLSYISPQSDSNQSDVARERELFSDTDVRPSLRYQSPPESRHRAKSDESYEPSETESLGEEPAQSERRPR